MRTMRIEPMRLIEGRAVGEMTGRWSLSPAGRGTHARYDWMVDVTQPWMRPLQPVLWPVFA
jgi:hypothetical protein